ncbi:UBA/THIF-type NAD/FAD binding protein [Caldicellulosiruptor kronotskyensis 2002]|uniref:UBA/THIF-type NAD/FAD binding protein n=1 Tax=Caldicellulosiruptor kronotskyensis (strain DSM 18902 / VKM B-2412 / 2002) TaxID=632348 RepID=E4SG01_CALK2|nr:ThiF family adenylyltransferase [Caldicellulosiruptor kronotskyensis]ADQ46676.1 UBA/THIF-type NAD/FAD binding protein [Caldicellulosiruptor kronotskyensis 2002]
MAVQKRYLKNLGALSIDAQKKLLSTTVAVVGVGGIGGFLIEGLARLGVKKIIAVDMDSFDETNLNRQIISNVNNLGKFKVFEAEKRVKEINPAVYFEPIKEKAYLENLDIFLMEASYIFDATDNIEIRKSLSKFAQNMGKILIHGGCAGWYAQIAVITKDTPGIEKLLGETNVEGAEKDMGNPIFAPMLTAALELSEFCKLISVQGENLIGKCMVVNLLTNEYRVFEF